MGFVLSGSVFVFVFWFVSVAVPVFVLEPSDSAGGSALVIGYPVKEGICIALIGEGTFQK